MRKKDKKDKKIEDKNEKNREKGKKEKKNGYYNDCWDSGLNMLITQHCKCVK